MATTFHFEFLGEAGWEPVGAGMGEGKDPVRSAFREVRDLSGDTLSPGTYRVIASTPTDARWETFRVDSLGRAFRAQRPRRPAPS